MRKINENNICFKQNSETMNNKYLMYVDFFGKTPIYLRILIYSAKNCELSE